MSRVGKVPIAIPAKVKVTQRGDSIAVEGPKGRLNRDIPAGVDVSIKDSQVVVEPEGATRRHRALHGLTRSLINNMIVGVTTGFSRQLEIVGVGYRVEQQGDYLYFSLGFSHPILYELPTGVEATIEGTKITLSGSDREVLGRAAATIRGFRPPEPYKGKGIRYIGEFVRHKVGKAGAA